MSTKGTILCFPWCHIYEDVKYTDGKEQRLLCIDVDYGETDEELDCIEVDFYSDFAVMLLNILKHCTLSKEDLQKIVRETNKEPK